MTVEELEAEIVRLRADIAAADDRIEEQEVQEEIARARNEHLRRRLHAVGLAFHMIRTELTALISRIVETTDIE